MKNLYLLKTGVLAFSLMLSQLAFAAPAGSVTFKVGDVTITHADKTVVQAAKNAELNAGDTIETKDGRLQLALIDGGKVSLQPNTIYKINKYEFASGKEDGSEYGFTELIKGGLRTVSGLIGHKNRDHYQLKTAVATIGIRGTEFTVNFNDNNLLMTTNHGSVDVCNAGGCLNAVTGESIEVIGIGGSPKPSGKKAKAAAAAPAGGGKAVFAAGETIAVAALAQSVIVPAPVLPASGRVVSLAVPTGLAIIDNQVLDAAFTFDANNNLTSVIDPQSPYNAHPLSFSSFNSSDGIVAWGQASRGAYTDANNVNNPMSIYDYIAGVAPAAGSLANITGTHTLTAFGSTAPFLVSGSTVTTLGAANQVTGTFTFNFTASTFGYNFSVPTTNDGIFKVSALNMSLNPNYSFSGASSVTHVGSSNPCAGGIASCSGTLQGSWFGANGERVGLQYGINVLGLNGQVNGGVVFH